ncbi:diguanylate cyclase (GGDEF)-like protein [Neorhizobium huautlense]|uniref:diguanylate cyclase n=1 Tax=Neorhizobium huautlense TaxID=67774 RepID=A0ABT9Q099_9HYPH|nr:sensor domain-containing diguanylate cyclase [Neorhizobium huautlense]MDP9840161.1 diguanylate cyclase (GGDEF)-like protein [Neorhizobium huautlense]
MTTVLDQIVSKTGKRERERLAALEQLDVMDGPRDQGFDRFVRLIKEIYGIKIGIVSLIDAHRQWYQACDGLPFGEVPRDGSFCKHVVLAEEAIIVPDTTLDPRFSDHPAVTGDLHIRFYAGMPIKTKAGHVIGTLCAIHTEPRTFDDRDTDILRELAGAAMDRIELLQTASTDSLTEALTRRAFKAEADQMVTLARRHAHALSCIVLDIDHFKSINDTYGHAAGDIVLKAVSATCKSTLRATDLFGRFGGEEFVVVLPYVDMEGAMATAERLRKALATQTVDIGGKSISVTASFGVAARSLTGKDIETLLAQADAAMYRAKQEGRNQCRSWSTLRKEAGKATKGTRKRVLRTGFILFDERRSLVDCSVKSLGADSAGLVVSDAFGLPEEFLLQIPADGIETMCRVIAHDGQNLEVMFQ